MSGRWWYEAGIGGEMKRSPYEVDEQQELREAMERDCPCCGAPAGFPCNAPMEGVFLKQPHLSRRLDSRGE